MWVQDGLSRIMDHGLAVPQFMPMVFWVCSYVRTIQMPRFGRGWDGGRIASQALNELDCPAVK